MATDAVDMPDNFVKWPLPYRKEFGLFWRVNFRGKCGTLRRMNRLLDFDIVLCGWVELLNVAHRTSLHAVNPIMTIARWEVGCASLFEQRGEKRTKYGEELLAGAWAGHPAGIAQPGKGTRVRLQSSASPSWPALSGWQPRVRDSDVEAIPNFELLVGALSRVAIDRNSNLPYELSSEFSKSSNSRKDRA